MPRTRTAAVCVLLLCAFALPACHSQSTQNEGTVTDDLDRSVEIDQPVQRVVTLAPNLTEIVYAAGGGGMLVGVSTSDDYPASVDTLPHFSALPVDFEKIVTLGPDLALATDQVNSPKDAETLTALGIPVYFFSFKTLQDVLDAIRETGHLLGTEAQADEAADSLRGVMDTLRARTSDAPRPRVLMLIGDADLYAFGKESYTHELIRLAGGNSVTDSIGTANPVLSEEFVLAARPDVIVGTWGEDYDVRGLVENHPALASVPAIRNGRIYGLNPDLITRPGPRLFEGALRLAVLLHPELFPAGDSSLASAAGKRGGNHPGLRPPLLGKEGSRVLPESTPMSDRDN